jgi:predicted MFS family arabinose efflux permease
MGVLTGRALVIAMCAGQVGNLLPHVVVPAIMATHLIPLWNLSGAQAGLMAGAYAFGYMLAVPVLAALTDRIDARLVLICGSVLSGISTAAFGMFADGLWSATAIWALAGVGFAGAYMPGLKALTDRVAQGEVSRSITLYTSSYSVGVGLSFLVSQVVADSIGWREAFYVTALGPLLMIAACFGMAPFQPPPAKGRLLDFRPVLRNRPAMGYVLGYGAHCFELYGMRTWIVSFWVYVAARGDALLSPITLSVLIALLSFPSSILGNEVAIRAGRHRAITTVMIASTAVGLAIGWFANASPVLLLVLVLIYAVTIPADSGALTSGMAMSADPANRGATMAMHSTVGFGLSALGGWLGGVALDAFGGPASPNGWFAVFAVFAAGSLLGPLALWWSRRAERV